MEKYYDIHVVYDEESNEGYSLFVVANSKEDAIKKAKNEGLFVSEYDFEDVDYIEEISKDEYDIATNI